MELIKKSFTLIAMMLISISAMAVPAKSQWQEITLANGTSITVKLVGDEYGHWYIDKDGKALTIENGVASYLTENKLAEKQTLRYERMAKANESRMARFEKNMRLTPDMTLRDLSLTTPLSSTNGLHRAVTDVRKPLSGKHKGIVILVEFSDLSFTAGSQKVYDDMFNMVGYKDNNHIGSLHDYFYDQSYGKFDLSFDVIGPVKVSRSYTYYGQNSGGQDKYPCSMVIEAVKLAANLGVDFSQYDWDKDGYVDQVYIVYPGYGENAGAPANTLWPHEWELSSGKSYGDGSGAIAVSGVKVNTYAISAELANYSGKNLNGIGLACHEFSHCLGFPDFYDTNYNEDGSVGQGMMDWDVLDNGSYNGPRNDGEVPAGYTAYERWMAGWLNPIELDKPCYVTDMASLTKDSRAYVIYNEGNYNECYLLENRQTDSWDAYVGGSATHGMLITHVNYSASAWRGNTVNTKAYSQGFTFVPADNSYGNSTSGSYTQTLGDYAGDPFPGTSKVTEFTDYSKPAATLYNANKDGRKFLGKPITDIAEKDGIIRFTFNGGDSREPAPIVLDPTDITENGFTANWEATKGADSYSIKVYEYQPSVKETSLLITQDCSKFQGTDIGADQTVDMSSELDALMSTPGWLGVKIYEGPKRIKMGTRSGGGLLATPLMKAPKDGCVTITLSQSTYSTDAQAMDIYAVAADGTEDEVTITMRDRLATEGLELSPDVSMGFKKNIRLSGITSDFRIVMQPAKRAYIYSFDMYEGNLTDAELEGNAPMRRASQEMKGDTICVTGITDTHYTLTNIPYKYCSYTVASVKGGEESKWSKPVVVTLGADGIMNIAISKPSHDNGVIYNMRGQVAGFTEALLPKGIYLRNGKKFIVR